MDSKLPQRSSLLALWFALFSWLGCSAEAGGDAVDVYSESFFPLEAQLADGAPAKRLSWRYRANRGEAVPYLDQAGAMVRFDDSDWTVEDGKLTQSHAFKISIPSRQRWSTTASQTTSRLTDSAPHALTNAVADTEVNEVADGERSSRRFTSSSTYDPPRKFFYDRDDLELLDVEYSESQDVHTTSEQRQEVDGQKMAKVVESNHSISWTLLEKLESFEVAGHPYRNVVKVRFESSSGSSTIQWLAKGVGVVRSEHTADMPTGSEISLLELVDTNLAQR